jgi:hypothetical protein
VRADVLLGVGLAALLARLLGLGRALLDEPDREEDEERELQVLRLPVLGHRLREARGRQIAAQAQRLRGLAGHLGMPGLEVVVLVPARDRLADQRGQEEGEEGEAEALLAQQAAHQWCVRPMTVKYASPVTMMVT